MKKTVILLMIISILYGGYAFAAGKRLDAGLRMFFGATPVSCTTCSTGYETLKGSDGLVILDADGDIVCLPE